MLPILSILCVTSISSDETLECFREHSWSSGRRLASHKYLAGSSSRRPSVASVPSSLRYRKGPTHRWSNMGNGCARGTQGGFQRRKLEASKRWRPPASSRVETGCLRGRDELLQGEERRTTVSMVYLAWCSPPVFRSPSVWISKCSWVFFTGCGFLIIERTAQSIQKRRKAALLLQCCFWWAANRLCCGPGMGPVESSALVALA